MPCYSCSMLLMPRFYRSSYLPVSGVSFAGLSAPANRDTDQHDLAIT